MLPPALPRHPRISRPLLVARSGHAAAPIDETRDLGFMLWDIDHANDHASLFFRARLENGIMTVPPPGSPEIRR
jgi:CRISPR-associated protein Cas5d